MVNWPAIGATILPNLGGFIGTKYTIDAIPNWYNHLNKPKWTPPNYVFGPMWTFLYSSMGYASYLVWRDGGGFEGDARLPLALFGGQLLINWSFTPVFFGLKKLGWSTCIVVGNLVGAVATAGAMYGINKNARNLMIPYIAWLSLASAVSFKLWRMNPKSEQQKKLKK